MNSNRRFSLKKSTVASALVLSQIISMTPLAVQAADVRFAGQPVMSNLAGAGSLSADARAEQAQQNLDNALVAAKDRTPAAVNITYVKGLPVITLGGYQVITVDAASAKANGVTPAVLAQKWADGIRNSLRDQGAVQSYVSQLSGDYAANAPAVASAPPQQNYAPQGAPQGQPEYFGSQQQQQQQPPQGQQQYGASASYNYAAPQGGTGYTPPPRGYRQGRVAYAPAGLVIPAMLSTSIATQVARPGDMIQAGISQAVILGDSQIPSGSVLIGQVAEAKKGGYLGMSGRLEIQFNRLRTPDGTETPIVAHIVGGIGKYDDKDGNGELVGETWKGKTVQAVGRGAVGAGVGAALGTAVGAIAGGRGGVGRGAWSGTAIGGGVGVAQSLILRKGKDVTIPSGTPLQIQLDAPSSIAGAGPGPYVGAY
ncbi:MAG: hypothetical protein SGJ27_27180 [Candidatus Melainabacteria bacterium]|mgnify:CR=1 FL=1|nr:hypothetical protein [Candidatus Melainabacteria bacterium]